MIFLDFFYKINKSIHNLQYLKRMHIIETKITEMMRPNIVIINTYLVLRDLYTKYG